MMVLKSSIKFKTKINVTYYGFKTKKYNNNNNKIECDVTYKTSYFILETHLVIILNIRVFNTDSKNSFHREYILIMFGDYKKIEKCTKLGVVQIHKHNTKKDSKYKKFYLSL